MSMTDPIADMLTRIRKRQRSGKPTVTMPSSKLKIAIVKVLKDEGYVADFHVDASDGARPARDRAEVLRRPARHRPPRARLASGPAIYRGKDELPKVLGGLGIAIVSTPKGVMTDTQARQRATAAKCSASWPKGGTNHVPSSQEAGRSAQGRHCDVQRRTASASRAPRARCRSRSRRRSTSRSKTATLPLSRQRSPT